MATRSEAKPQPRGRARRALIAAGILALLAGCGEPSQRELENRRELEALLTAIALKNTKELDRDIRRIENRREAGTLSDASYKDLEKIFTTARGGDWSRAEKLAYELRESKPFFK